MPDRKDELKKARANARPAIAGAAKPEKPAPAPKPAKVKVREQKEWTRTEPPILPEDCPVLCLGRDKRRYAIIDSNGQFLEIEVNQLSSDGLADLFAHPKSFAWLWSNFPKFDKNGYQIGWDKERAKLAVMMACASKGPFNFEHRVRGEGAWRDDDGRLHWHLGDRVLVVEPDQLPVYETSTLVHGYVYPKGARQPVPAEKRDPDAAAVKDLFKLLQRWHWSREKEDPALDARMMLGWLGCAIIGGALGWRPALWLRGPRGAGKSTLLLLLYYVLGGDGSAIKATDASSAGIFTALRNRSIPVLVDEAEPRAGDSRHMDNVISLARAASSGGDILRSGANLESRTYSARASFLFSSINVPHLETADLTRIVMLRILAMVKGAGDLVLDPEQLAIAGAQIRRVLVDSWHVWPRILSAWRHHFMGKHELEARVADTWGSVLAMADLMLNAESYLAGDMPAAEHLEKWTKPIADEVKAMLEERGTDHDKVVKHLLTSKIETWARGQQWPFETIVAIAAGWAIPGDMGELPEDLTRQHRANSFLVTNGFKVIRATPPASKDEAAPAPPANWYLACHKDHRGAKKLFEDTIYKNNGHLQQLEQVPGAYSSRQRFAAGQRDPAVMVPIAYLLGDAPAPASSPPTPPIGDEIPPATMEPA